MDVQDYDDTGMTSEEFERAMASGAPADVTNLGGRVAGEGRGEVAKTASSAVTRTETVRLVPTRDTTITGHLELAGT